MGKLSTLNDDIQKRISRNLRLEARLFVRNPTHALTPRSPTQTAERETYIQEEKVEFDAEVAAAQNAKIREITERLNLKFGDEWQEWAKSLYIDHGDHITSIARKWKEELTWYYDTELEKIKIIEKLVMYKAYDRARGRGDVNDDLLNLEGEKP